MEPDRTAARARARRGPISVSHLLCVSVIATVSITACRREPHRPVDAPRQVVAWRTVGSWSGRGNRQTESFTSDSGALRLRWSTTHEEPDGAGTFHVTAHSAISGRLLQEAVDHRGTGSGIAYVNQDPHVFYLLIESDHIDWTLNAEEAIAGAAAAEPRAR